MRTWNRWSRWTSKDGAKKKLSKESNKNCLKEIQLDPEADLTTHPGFVPVDVEVQQKREKLKQAHLATVSRNVLKAGRSKSRDKSSDRGFNDGSVRATSFKVAGGYFTRQKSDLTHNRVPPTGPIELPSPSSGQFPQHHDFETESVADSTVSPFDHPLFRGIQVPQQGFPGMKPPSSSRVKKSKEKFDRDNGHPSAISPPSASISPPGSNPKDKSRKSKETEKKPVRLAPAPPIAPPPAFAASNPLLSSRTGSADSSDADQNSVRQESTVSHTASHVKNWNEKVAANVTSVPKLNSPSTHSAKSVFPALKPAVPKMASVDRSDRHEDNSDEPPVAPWMLELRKIQEMKRKTKDSNDQPPSSHLHSNSHRSRPTPIVGTEGAYD